jgi:hypothetical protein
MIENFSIARGDRPSEFLDLNHTSNALIPVSLMIPKFAREAGIELGRTSQPGH